MGVAPLYNRNFLGWSVKTYPRIVPVTVLNLLHPISVALVNI